MTLNENETHGSQASSDDSIHERIQNIINETDNDRKSEISSRIKFGDSFVKTALLFGFWGFWIFWLLVILAGF